MATIMIVDDEAEIADLIEIYLQMEHHTVLKFTDPAKVLEADLSAVEAAVLDVMMPGIDGLTLCRQLRKQGCTFPIIMLTAKDSDRDIIGGLAFGADDYMIKPFNPLELTARLSAQLRRVRQFSGRAAVPPAQPAGLHQFNGLEVDANAHTCTLYGGPVVLTPTEFSILLLLFQNQGRVLSGEEIFETIWKEKYLESNNTVMTHIQKLRKKLDDTGKRKKFIQTIWGVGYKLDDNL